MRLIDIVVKYSEKSWDWYLLSRNPLITIRDVLDHSYLPWNWYYLSRNPNSLRRFKQSRSAMGLGRFV